MKTYSLKKYIFVSFFIQIAIIGILMAVLGYYIVENDVIARVQKEVTKNIDTARMVYDNEINKIKTALVLTRDTQSLIAAKGILGLDYVFEASLDSKESLRSDIAVAAFGGEPVGGSRIIAADELQSISKVLLDRAKTKIEYTLKAKPVDKEILENALAIEYAVPLENVGGEVYAVRYAGRIINRDFDLVDKIRDVVFGRESYNDIPIGTVTMFQDDVRIATNVLNTQGQRAIGTRVSEEVYEEVVKKGNAWFDKAFVVTDWYFTAYEPIRNIKDETIGILYVGVLQKPFIDLKTGRFLMFLVIIAISGVLALVVSVFLTAKISRPLYNALKASKEISLGHLSYRLTDKSSISELNQLVSSFNSMAKKLKERQDRVNISNKELEVMNKRYLDLVGFVSHELKGVLASIILNAYSLKNEILGPITEAQKKALDSVIRNLDYLSQTVKNFLNLSRVEKEEMVLNKREILIRENIFEVCIEALKQQADEKNISIENNIDSNIKVKADLDLMQIVANNLLTNAIKYGKAGGKIVLSSKFLDDKLEIEVYNEGRPIAEVDIDKLFQKFSRITYSGMEKVKGTGIGLFITKEIIIRHRGRIWVHPTAEGNSFIFQINKD